MASSASSTADPSGSTDVVERESRGIDDDMINNEGAVIKAMLPHETKGEF